LVRASLGLLGLVAGYGASGLFGPALNLVHRSFALVLAATLSAHVRLPSVVMHARAHWPLLTLDAERAGTDTLRPFSRLYRQWCQPWHWRLAYFYRFESHLKR
jgi:hypothetical protein